MFLAICLSFQLDCFITCSLFPLLLRKVKVFMMAWSVSFGSEKHVSRRGRRLVWTRIHAWGACDPGFKSQRPHHDNSGPILGLHHFLLLKILTSPNSQTYSNPASTGFAAFRYLSGFRVKVVFSKVYEVSIDHRAHYASVPKQLLCIEESFLY